MNRVKEKGAALIVSMILLTVATIVTVASMRGGTMQEKMTANQHNKTISLMAAEAGASAIIAWANDPDSSVDMANIESEITSAFSSDTQVSGGSQGFYRVADIDSTERWVEIEGVSKTAVDAPELASTTIRIEYSSGSDFANDAPAAISCFGGACDIRSGTGGHNQIDGRDHALPSATCNGGTCRMNPIDETNPDLAKPSVYLESGGTLDGDTGDGGAYRGLHQNGTETTDDSDFSVWEPDDYTALDSDVPDGGAFFGDDGVGQINSGAYEFGDRADPKITYVNEDTKDSGNSNYAGLFIIDGADFEFTGTVIFEGLVVIKGCGSLSMGGTPIVYGAIVIDSTGCPADYDAFAGNGTPSVRFSSEALDNVSNLFGAFDVSTWREVIPSS
ncbi:MAG: pilus assembly PilX family protein [Halothiobacillaceae bacterium]